MKNFKVIDSSPYYITVFGGSHVDIVNDFKERGKKSDAFLLGLIKIEGEEVPTVKDKDHVQETKFETPDPALEPKNQRPKIDVKKVEDIEKRKEEEVPKKPDSKKEEEKTEKVEEEPTEE
jgi:hypothetical protein